jgi:predicted TIM-barrel fold metal-dependent hydrolase
MCAGAIDFHVHAFPDGLAARAIQRLEANTTIRARLDGRISSLLASMDGCGIARSVVCSIATRPEQFEPILAWSKEVRSDRIFPFPSLHPDDPDFRERIRRIRGEGFKGIKLHPYYQDFDVDDEKLFPLYEAIAAENLILVMHSGFDMSDQKNRRADPKRTAAVIERFPGLKYVACHLGGWKEWPEVERCLIGKPVYFDTSYSLEFLDGAAAKRMLAGHPQTHILFGSDSPWADQSESLQLVRELGLDAQLENDILGGNAQSLLEG